MRYMPDNLIKYECRKCSRSFIVSEYQLEELKQNSRKALNEVGLMSKEQIDELRYLRCPYCLTRNIEDVAKSNDETLDGLGCLGIYHEAGD